MTAPSTRYFHSWYITTLHVLLNNNNNNNNNSLFVPFLITYSKLNLEEK